MKLQIGQSITVTADTFEEKRDGLIGFIEKELNRLKKFEPDDVYKEHGLVLLLVDINAKLSKIK